MRVWSLCTQEYLLPTIFVRGFTDGVLPNAECQRLVPHLERVPLSFKQVLHKAGESIEYVYFPHRAIVSLISTPEQGSKVEVGLVGNEGIVGIPLVST